MKATCDRQALADAITWVAQAIPRRTTHEAALGMRILANQDGLTLSASDYEVSHTAHVDARVLDDGECLVPAGFVREVVGGMRGQDIDLVLEGARLTASAGRSSYAVQVLKLEDSPRLPDFPDEVGQVDAEHLGFMTAAVATSVDVDPAFPLLMGINLSVSDGNLHAAATKRFTLAAASCPWNGAEFSCTAPGKGMQAAIKGLRGVVMIGWSGGLLGFRDAERAVTMRTFDETERKYPIWRQAVRPASADKVTATLDLADLIAALKLASTVVTDRQPIALVIGDAAVEVAIDGEELGAGAEVLEAELQPEDAAITVGMNVRYLLDVLTAVRAERVEIGVVNARTSLIVRPVGHDRAVHLAQPKPLGGSR